MRRLPHLTPLAPLVLAAAILGGCSGLGDSIMHPGGKPIEDKAAAPLTPLNASKSIDILQSDAAQPQIEALTAALDRLNQNQAQLQVALQDLQTGAARQADEARLRSDELVSARRGVLVFGVVAAAAVLVALLLTVIFVRQSRQLRRAVKKLAEAEDDADPSTEPAGRLAPGEGRRPLLGTAGGALAAGGAGGSGAAGPGSAGSGPGSSQAARLRKRPPVG